MDKPPTPEILRDIVDKDECIGCPALVVKDGKAYCRFKTHADMQEGGA